MYELEGAIETDYAFVEHSLSLYRRLVNSSSACSISYLYYYPRKLLLLLLLLLLLIIG